MWIKIFRNDKHTFTHNLSRLVNAKFEDCGVKNEQLVLIFEAACKNCVLAAQTTKPQYFYWWCNPMNNWQNAEKLFMLQRNRAKELSFYVIAFHDGH